MKKLESKNLILAGVILFYFFGFTSLKIPVAQAVTIEDLIVQIKTIQQQIATLQNQLNEQQKEEVVTQTTYTFTRSLKYGDTGTDVRNLQTCLKSDPVIYPEGLITSYFGSLTKAAVIRFQEKYADEILKPFGLAKGTGLVGESTRAKLNAICSVSSESESIVSQEKPTTPEVKVDLKPEIKPESGFKPETDNIPPVILDITVTDVTATSAKITWRTNEITKDITDWDKSILESKSPEEWSNSHWVKLINLQPNKTYKIPIIVEDKAGNKATLESQLFPFIRKSFTTPGPYTEIPKLVIPKFEPIKIPDICVNCLGTDTNCGCSNCTDCNKLDGWVNVGNPYHSDLGPGGFYMNQKQEYRDYFCSGTFCEYKVTNTQTKRTWIKDSSPPLYPGFGLPKDFGKIHPFDPGVRQDPGPIIPFK